MLSPPIGHEDLCHPDSRRLPFTAEGWSFEALVLDGELVVPDAEGRSTASVSPIRSTLRAVLKMARILVADDNADIRSMLAAILELDGHEAMALDNGFAVLADEVKRRLPDAIILDIGLPSLDGIQVSLRQKYGYPLRLIAYSGFDDATTRRKIMQANFDAVFTKPAPIAKLLDAIGEAHLRRREHLSDRRAERRGRFSY